MFPGIVVGAVGAIALSRIVLRRKRWERHNRRFCSRGRPFFLRRLSQKLDLDRDQQKEVESVYMQMRNHMGALRVGARELRGALADALAGERFDRARVDEVFAQKRAAFEAARTDMVAGLARVHDILTPLQREQLSELLGRGAGGAGHGDSPPASGPYR